MTPAQSASPDFLTMSTRRGDGGVPGRARDQAGGPDPEHRLQCTVLTDHGWLCSIPGRPAPRAAGTRMSGSAPSPCEPEGVGRAPVPYLSAVPDRVRFARAETSASARHSQWPETRRPSNCLIAVGELRLMLQYRLTRPAYFKRADRWASSSSSARSWTPWKQRLGACADKLNYVGSAAKRAHHCSEAFTMDVDGTHCAAAERPVR